jgi:hypothetical protein
MGASLICLHPPTHMLGSMHGGLTHLPAPTHPHTHTHTHQPTSPLTLCACMHMQLDRYEVFSDLTNTALYGAVLAWMVGVCEPPRYAWLYQGRR